MSPRTRYLLSMASLSPVHLTIVAAVMATTDQFERLTFAIPANLAWFIVVNLIGAWFIFRPIDRFFRGEGGRDSALRRIRRLTPLSVAWGVTLLVPMMSFALFVLQVFCPGCDHPSLLSFRLSMIVVLSVFCGTFLYFLIDDFTAQLKGELFRRYGISAMLAGGRVMYKFLAAFIAVGVLPISLAFLEAFVFMDIRPLQGLSSHRAFLLDLALASFMALTALFFIQRNLKRPLDSLLFSLNRVAGGDLDAKAPVMTDDEIGALTVNFNRMVDGLNEREFLRETFGRYVPEEVAKVILANRGMLLPQRRYATILYTDIAGFTTICEGMAPERVVAMLNEYFSALVEVTHRYKGVVTQFQGDALLAVYNIPIEDANHATDAVLSALEIRKVVSQRRFGDGIKLPTRIGVNTGTVVAGAVGAGNRLSYTVHGDAVNVAARLEQMNKKMGTTILVSDYTRELVRKDIRFERLGKMEIRGKTEPLIVYTVSTERDGGVA